MTPNALARLMLELQNTVPRSTHLGASRRRTPISATSLCRAPTGLLCSTQPRTSSCACC